MQLPSRSSRSEELSTPDPESLLQRRLEELEMQNQRLQETVAELLCRNQELRLALQAVVEIEYWSQIPHKDDILDSPIDATKSRFRNGVVDFVIE